MNIRKGFPSLFFLLFFVHILCAQTVDSWQERVPATFVFALSNEEAENLFFCQEAEQMNQLIGETLKHPPYAVFGTSGWEDAPDSGHFLYFNIIENKVEYEYRSFIPYEIMIIPQYGAFTIQVRDQKGRLRKDAVVTLFYESYNNDDGKWVKENREVFYDSPTKTYSITIRPEEKSRTKLVVELDGMRSFFSVGNNGVEEKRVKDAVYEQENPKIRFYSYLITDKYSYRPGDTVRMKSYILGDNRKPLKKELSLQTGRYRDMKTIETISPYRPGSYMGEFVLEPSLRLRLDKTYTLRLVDEKGVIVAATNFKYEDYQLLDYKLEVEPSLKNHFHTDTNYIRIKATDVNTLPLPDSKVNFTLLRSHVAKAYEDGYTLPETIYHEEFFMPESEPLIVPVSGDLFGKANLWYIVQVQITTPDNRTLTYRDQIRYDYMYQDIICTPRDGKLVFEYVRKGKSVPVKATLKYNANQQARTIPVELPYMEVLSPDVTRYELKVDLMGEPVVIFPEDVIDIRIEGGLADKYLDISLHNPMAIEATWYIYEGKKLRKKQTGSELRYKGKQRNNKANWHVDLFYRSGDELKEIRETFRPLSNNLDITTTLPERIWPGQEVEATVSVRDFRGRPVSNIDLTTFAVNGLLGEEFADLPYYAHPSESREEKDKYDIDEFRIGKYNNRKMPHLDYSLWNPVAQLDTLPYYRFHYPEEDKPFIYTEPVPGGITQFAPFVMENGTICPVYLIKCNDSIVWSSRTENKKIYSFPVEAGKKHTIQLYLDKQSITIETEPDFFKAGMKTIVSLNRCKKTKSVFYKKENYSWKYENREDADFRYWYYSINFKDIRNYIGPGQPVIQDSEKEKIVVEAEAPTPILSQFIISHNKTDLVIQLEKEQPKPVQKVILIHKGCEPMDTTPRLTEGLYDLFIFYAGGEYMRRDSLQIWPQTYHFVNMENRNVYPADNHIQEWLETEKKDKSLIRIFSESDRYIRTYFSPSYPRQKHTNQRPEITPFHETEKEKKPEKVRKVREKKKQYSGYGYANETLYATISFADNKISGFITEYDTGYSKDTKYYGMPGVTISVKGTIIGTITDINGSFSLTIEEKHLKSKNITVIISYLGYDSIELTLTPGSSQNATLTSYSPMLEEVVVISYGNAPKNEPASKTVNKETYSGEVITKKREQLVDREAERTLYRQLMSLDRLRTNFSDVGFWVPNLYTDKKGKATFKVMFPDNLTRWDAVVYAMNPRLQTGTHRTSIHSYKPLMAEMIQPAFMIEGDTAYIETYIRDYTGEDSRSGNLRLKTNSTVLVDETINFRTTHQGTRAIYAIQDTLHTRLVYTDEDGYRDGEEKKIPILQQGVQATFETTWLLMEGDTLPLQLPEEGIATLHLFTQTLNIHKNLAGYLSGYEYACNEQLASKLTGLLVHKEIADLQGEPFLYDKNIDEIINRLVNNQNSVNMWGWWNRVMPEYSLVWMTHHILNALRIARQSGYTSAGKIRFATQPPARITSQASLQDSILLLQSGTLVSQPDSLQKQVEQLEASVHRLADAGKPYIREKLLMIELRKQNHLPYSIEEVTEHLALSGNGYRHVWDRNAPEETYDLTLIAYRILQDEPVEETLKVSLLYTLLKEVKSRWNTYKKAQLLMAVLPQIKNWLQSDPVTATLLLEGTANRKVTQFPFRQETTTGETDRIIHSKGLPVFVSTSYRQQTTEAKADGPFAIRTWFDEGDTLTTGKPVNLWVEIRIDKPNSNYLMIEVPIPAGCIYDRKPMFKNETHREYFKEKTVIFCSQLKQGTYLFPISLLPRFAGTYHLNPAKIEEMYSPGISSTTQMKLIRIRKDN